MAHKKSLSCLPWASTSEFLNIINKYQSWYRYDMIQSDKEALHRESKYRKLCGAQKVQISILDQVTTCVPKYHDTSGYGKLLYSGTRQGCGNCCAPPTNNGHIPQQAVDTVAVPTNITCNLGTLKLSVYASLSRAPSNMGAFGFNRSNVGTHDSYIAIKISILDGHIMPWSHCHLM